MYVFMHICIIYLIIILFCSHRIQTLMCGRVHKQPGILKSCDFLALREDTVRKPWWGSLCVLRCSSGQGGHSASLEPLKEGRKRVVCSGRQGTWLVWPSKGHGQWVRIAAGRGGLRCFACPGCWHKVSTLPPCHLHAAPCSVVQLPIVPGEHPPVTLGRGLESRMCLPPPPYNDFMHVAKAKLTLNSSWELSQILQILYQFFIVPSYTESHLTSQSY